MIDWIGYFAATCTTLAFLPQAIMILRTNNSDGVSLNTYLLFAIGLLAWLGYGILLESWPIILANTVSFFIAVTILLKKIMHLNKRA